MDKVKLPKKVADAMVRFQQQYGSEALFRIEEYVGEVTAQADAYDVVFWMRKGNHRMYYTALVNGYEVEETPEDKVRKLIDNAGNFSPPDSDTAYVSGIIAALNIYGIKIEGVNA